MKQFIFFLTLFFPITVFAQIVETQEEKDAKTLATKQFKKDSTELARKKLLSTLNNDLNNLSRTDDAAELNSKLNEISSNLKAFGDTKLTPLSGDITISKGDFSTAEAKKSVDEALDSAIDVFKGDLSTAIGSNAVLVYDPLFFKGIYQYQVVKKELGNLEKKYESLTNKIEDAKSSGKPVTALGTVAMGISVARQVADLATLFKTETKITVNNESIGESYIISKIVKKLGVNKKIYYPSLFPINPLATENSELFKSLANIDSKKMSIELLINEFKEKKDINKTNEEIDKKNIEISKKNVELLKAKQSKPSDTTKIKQDIAILKAEIVGLNALINSATEILAKLLESQSALDKQYDTINENLNFVIDKDKNVTALGMFLSIEQLLDKLKSSFTLRISASSLGTTIVKKSNWKTKLSSTGSVQIEYLLFDKDGMIIQADAFNKYDEKGKQNELSK